MMLGNKVNLLLDVMIRWLYRRMSSFLRDACWNIYELSVMMFAAYFQMIQINKMIQK